LVPAPFVSDYPLFAFIDPFGPTGAPFECVAEILASPCSEVLLNLDADGVSRIYKAKQSANHLEVLTKIFGDRSWEDKLNDNQLFYEQCRAVLDVYKERLRALPGVKYIFEVEMRDSRHMLSYFLVFASKHPLGLIKMKEAMKRISQNGTYIFADTDVGQTALFHDDNPEAYCMALCNAFKGKNVDYDGENDDVTAYALNQTPFLNAKSMLKILENKELVTADSLDPKRKRRTFNNTVRAIYFHGKVQNGRLF